ncbi:TRMT1-like protein isoform X4 [Rhodnius prolixus]|uniref:TRMT1-like protein isoform X4 n=1 Tax=Rhodnius prolixus TaxID=13249 RepID=UPI003D18DCEE
MEVTNKIDFKDRLRTFQENSIKIRGDNKTSCPRKTPYYFNEDYKFNRLFVSSVLAAYVKSGLSVSSPVKCADVLGACGASGITWKKHLGDSVNVIINDKIEMACDLIKDNIQRNHLQITVSSKDPCIFLHERGYNFVSAISHNKSIEVLCSTVFKNTFTVAVLCTKSPQVSSKCTENLRLLKHCMVCEERLFYPASDGFPVDPKNIQLDCECSKNAPGKTAQELGPLWAGPIFNADFIQEMLANKFGSDNVLKSTLSIILEEARCVSKEDDAIGGKRLKIILEPCPPFYYNLHKHHPKIPQQLKLNRVIDELRNKGFRASKTHFDKLAVRTNAPLMYLFYIMKKGEES